MNTEKIFWKVAAGLEQLLGEGSVWADWDVATGTLDVEGRLYLVYPDPPKLIIRQDWGLKATREVDLIVEGLAIGDLIEFVLEAK